VFHLVFQQNIGDFRLLRVLFLPLRGFQDCMKIQLDLNKLSEWCERNSLFLNVKKCKTVTFSRTRYHVKFGYMLAEEDEFFGACGRHGW
jgi:hypothetical protein